MGFVFLTGVLVAQTLANAALTNANTRLEISNRREIKANADLTAANERERARFALAQDAIRTFYTGVGEDLLLRQKEFATLRNKLLRRARDYYQRLEGLLEGHKDRESRLALGRAYRDVGELTNSSGAREEAVSVHQRALAQFEELRRDTPNDPEPRFEIGRSSTIIAHLLSSTARRAEAMQTIERGRTTLRNLVGAGAADEQTKYELAFAEHVYGILADTTDRVHERLGAYVRARGIMEGLVASNPSDEFRMELASICDSLGFTLRTVGQNHEANAAFDRRANCARPRSPPTQATRNSPTSWCGPWLTG